LKTVFDFVFKGFDGIGLQVGKLLPATSQQAASGAESRARLHRHAARVQEHTDYEILQSTNPDFNKAVVRVNVFSKDHRQTIQVTARRWGCAGWRGGMPMGAVAGILSTLSPKTLSSWDKPNWL
jgi:hypothetical protein